jgi:hypothetical protein
MPYQRLQWLFPLALTLHNGEEESALCEQCVSGTKAVRFALFVPLAIAMMIAVLLVLIEAFV